MKYWKEYFGHEPNIKGKRKKFDNTIYSFDIETTSFIILNGKQFETKEYLNFTKEEREKCIFMSVMYIWSFSINDEVYYGRTWNDLKAFMSRIEYWGTHEKKFVFVHNLAFEFQFLRNAFKFKNVFARKSRKPIKFELDEDLNFEFRCSYMMTNSSLEKLPDIYGLSIKKLKGNLDYNIIRNSKTKLSKKEMEYCEHDCLVIYYYILKELETYETVKNIPLTSTGHVRRELKEEVRTDFDYKNTVRRSVNTDGHVYNLLIQAFVGGYTHANWIYADRIIKNVISFDFTSSYPFVMLTEKYPATQFKKINVTDIKQLKKCFAYLIHVKFRNIKCKYYNNFISKSKCIKILKGQYDNGRVIGAEELEIILTDVDFYFIMETYEIEAYEFEEVYFSVYSYLPKQFMEFILQKYVNKTKFKNVEGKEVEYALEKAKFNSLYGMSVTNNVNDTVIFDNEAGWQEIELKNDEIIELLEKERKMGFLSFSYGVWVTAWARNNLLRNLIKLDKNVVYADTDSLKITGKFDINIINNYNKDVEEKIKNVSKLLDIDINKYMPEDFKGEKHLLGVFDKDAEYDEFITQGAKKYAFTKWVKNEKIKADDNIIKKGKEKSLVLGITVSGVPKRRCKSIKKFK